ncbi:MAG: hypothetical protein PHW29_04420 [Flavobacterium sp.]|nr:hypothetical protein [Flavobacterium sp.]
MSILTKENNENRKLKKPKYKLLLRLTEDQGTFLTEQSKITGTSINTLISLCVDLQKNKLPNYKVDSIEVNCLVDGELVKTKYSGNYNLTKKGE